eukprot:CAMPEP_0181033346 /NCGR_PEP_ID=MMETSP1070-20121207/7207_1 /TAXON_ID=265543 /ORGANISM="Minutocellus polymorphus, Strain NH13" /LENGTH=196 /DNA_ID=CAMNT_0023110765 /DNA_START=504 /DNA_END=1092 /DNA_ORIENTATION=+
MYEYTAFRRGRQGMRDDERRTAFSLLNTDDASAAFAAAAFAAAQSCRRLLLTDKTSSTDSGDGIGRLQLLLGKGGCGKSYVLDAVLTTLAEVHDVHLDEVAVFGTTGKAACLIQGSTVHSWSEGLCFPREAKDWKPLSGKSERQLQDRMGKIRAVFIDELSMLQQVQLHFIDQRLRQACPERGHLFFGGVPVILIG